MPINPADFVTTIDNKYLPLKPGTTLVYKTGDGSEVIHFQITRQTKLVDGVKCVVVHDVSREHGQLKEDTFDFFAQDKDGNVWYFGEAVKNYQNGVFHDTNGSWLAGVNGAEPGIIMLASPHAGQTVVQENAPGVAEDTATVLKTNASIVTPYASSKHALLTHEFTPLDPSLHENKSYIPGIGFVHVVNRTTGEIEQLHFIAFDGTAKSDEIAGNIGRDILRGHAGNDTLDAKAGNDVLVGGLGRDHLKGGAGRDVFDLNSTAESGRGAARDVVVDFTSGVDRIDLRTIDADTEDKGNQAFHFIGSHHFHNEEGELRYSVLLDHSVVEGDTNGDGRADFQIALAGQNSLVAGDFLL